MTENAALIRTNITVPVPVFTEAKKLLKKPMSFSGLVSALIADWVRKKKRDAAFEALRGTWVKFGGPDFKSRTEYNRWKAKIWGPATGRIIKESRGISG